MSASNAMHGCLSMWGDASGEHFVLESHAAWFVRYRENMSNTEVTKWLMNEAQYAR